MPNNKRKYKQAVVNTCNGMLLHHRRKCSADTCNNEEGPQNTPPREGDQVQKVTYCVILFTGKGREQVNPLRQTEGRRLSGREEPGEGPRHENYLELGRDGGCTTL